MPTIQDFEQIDMRVGRILEARDLPAARKPSYQLVIDFGPLGHKRSTAQLTGRYKVDDLVGRHVVAVVNLTPRRIAGFHSEVLVLGVPDQSGEVVLLQPDSEVPLGGRVY